MDNLIRFPKSGGFHTGGGGPEDPMLEARVARLENDMKDIKATLKSIETKLTVVSDSVSEIKGKLSQSPTWLQLIGAMIGTWGAGAAIAIAAIRFAPK